MIKKMGCLGLVLFMLLSIGYVNQVGVFANNHADTSFNFHFRSELNATTPRQKKDKTSSYMKCISIPNNRSYTAYVCGTNSSSGDEITDVSKGNSYLFKSGTVKFMKNWVYEDGYRYACILANRNYGVSFNASGVWSPDSVR